MRISPKSFYGNWEDETDDAPSPRTEKAGSGQWWTGVVQNAAFTAAGLVAALVVVELLFRAGQALQSRRLHNDRPKFYYLPETSPTMQDAAYAEVKPAGNFRIVVVGDSITFAPMMQFDDAFPKRLERMLNLNDTARRAEVINRGVSGFSTHHEVQEVKRAISQGADLVLVQVTLNDAELKPLRPGSTWSSKIRGQGRVKSGWLGEWRSLHYVIERIRNTRTHSEYERYFRDLYSNPAAWKLFADSFRQIASLASAKQVKVVAVVFPLLGFELDHDYPFHDIHRRISLLLDSNGIPHIDLFTAFQGIPIARLQLVPGKDLHPNEIGHRIAAERIYRWLIERDLVPEMFEAKRVYRRRMNLRDRSLKVKEPGPAKRRHR